MLSTIKEPKVNFNVSNKSRPPDEGGLEKYYQYQN